MLGRRNMWICRVRLHVCIYVCMYVCIYVCTYVCMYVCMHLCMCMCMHLCIYVWIYVCMHVCLFTCMYCIVLFCIVFYCIVLYCIIGNYGSLFLRLIGLVHSGCASDRPTWIFIVNWGIKVTPFEGLFLYQLQLVGCSDNGIFGRKMGISRENSKLTNFNSR